MFESNGPVRRYILNRPSKLNALDQDMIALLRPTVQVRLLPPASGDIAISRLNRQSRVTEHGDFHRRRSQVLSNYPLKFVSMQEWEESELCRIIVGSGNGRGFCSGGDVESTFDFSLFIVGLRAEGRCLS